MNEFGTLILWLTFISTLIAFLLIIFTKHPHDQKTHPGIMAAVVSCAGVLLSSLLLMISFIQGIFSIEFVYNNTEKSLPLIYKISAFRPGSAGSLLLWTAFLAILLLVLYAKKPKDEANVTVFGVIHFFILNFMVMTAFINNPFKHATPETDGFGGTIAPLFNGNTAIPIEFYDYSMAVSGIIILTLMTACPVFYPGRLLHLLPGGIAGSVIVFIPGDILKYGIFTKLSLALCALLTVNLLVSAVLDRRKMFSSRSNQISMGGTDLAGRLLDDGRYPAPLQI